MVERKGQGLTRWLKLFAQMTGGKRLLQPYCEGKRWTLSSRMLLVMKQMDRVSMRIQSVTEQRAASTLIDVAEGQSKTAVG